MTEKICKKCGYFQFVGKYCAECGAQLYPDVGNTIWVEELKKTEKHLKISRLPFCIKPKFYIWTGERIEGT